MPRFPRTPDEAAARTEVPAPNGRTRTASNRPAVAPALHPRNRYQGRYDFARLLTFLPELSGFVVAVASGRQSIDFSDPRAVRALNRALLMADYGIRRWDLPDGYLCPPIPGRADYLHALADLLAEDHAGGIVRGPEVTVLDVGVGANAIYPLIGWAEYGWRFVGTDVDTQAIGVARANLAGTPGLSDAVALRVQPERGKIFAGVVGEHDRFDLTLCNPPFHASAEDAARGSRRKWRNLGKSDSARSTTLNFGGRANELWCTGGEASFVRRMIDESRVIGAQVLWFSSLISSAENLPAVHRRLRTVGAKAVREVPMAQGSKRSRFVAWTFLDAEQRAAWRAARWAG